MSQRIYLDHAATTPMRPEAIAAVEDGMRRWANPSSPHAEGRAARAALEDARERIKQALGWDGELIFTSGASEALAIGLGRARGGSRFVSSVEHDAVFRAAPDARVLPVDDQGHVDRNVMAEALLSADRPVVAIQHYNSELGTMQPVSELAAQVRASGGVLISDCAQSAGRTALPDADAMIVSAHKLGGPPGIGALLVRDLALFEPSGGQEKGYRGGTENLPSILGFAAALEAIEWNERGIPTWLARLLSPPFDLLDLTETIEEEGGVEVRAGMWRANWIAAYAMPVLPSEAQLIRLDMKGFAVSVGSACSSGTLKRSRALGAFGIAAEVAERTIRVSFGWNTTQDDVRAFADAWVEIAREARKRAA